MPTYSRPPGSATAAIRSAMARTPVLGSTCGLRGPGGADGAERVGLALAAPVLAVGAVDLDDPDAGGGDVAGQAGAVAAGALDADQADGPEPAQPAQQPGVAGRGDGELRDAEQPADRIQRGSDVHVRVGVHAAGDGAGGGCLYDGQCHRFSLVKGWHAPAGRRSCEPRPLPRPRRSGRHHWRVP